METEKNISPNITLSVVMPAYNEEAHIKDNLLETSKILSSFLHRYEIIAVNDGSSDSTWQLIRRLLMQIPTLQPQDTMTTTAKDSL